MTGILNALIAGVSGAVKDAYFNLVSLLLPGNGTNGAQNNTFLDSGTANSGSGFTITRNGNTTQGTFSPFSQTGWSNRFDGSANYRLTIPDSTDLDLTGDFCLEMWVYVTANSSSGQLVCIGNENAGQNGFIFYLPGGTTTVSLYTNGGAPLTTSSGAIALNTWHHLALVRSGAGAGNTVIYVDGVSKGSAQITTSFTGIAANGLCIGQTYNGSFVGVSNTYISNVRLVKGSPVYTGAFTPPTSPLTAITNTVLLTCQSNRFVDTNTQTTAKTITVTGSPSVTPFSPFAPTSSYSAAAVGGSGYFDGTGDYLTVPASTAFSFGTSSFAIETWVYLDTVSNNGSIALNGSYGLGANSDWILRVGSSGSATGKWEFTTFFGGTAYQAISNSAVVAKTWTHIAAVRNGNTFTLYIDGVAQTTTATNTNSVGFSNQTTLIVGDNTSGVLLKGWFSNFRIVKGTAVYTGNFTPPTGQLATSGAASAAAYPSTTNVDTSFASSACSLLLNFTNAGVVDATAKNVLETVGNAQISTTQSKWGGGSISFDGTSNTGLKAPAGNLFTFGSGAFTVEFWVRFNSVAADQAVLNVTGTTNVLTFYVLSTGSLNYYLSSNGSTYDIASGVSVGSISTGQWYRVALVRSGNTFTPYLNTTAGTTSTSSSALATPSSGTFLHLGMSTAGTSNFNGYIDDVRVTRGVARDMTVLPSAPFPVQ